MATAGAHFPAPDTGVIQLQSNDGQGGINTVGHLTESDLDRFPDSLLTVIYRDLQPQTPPGDSHAEAHAQSSSDVPESSGTAEFRKHGRYLYVPATIDPDALKVAIGIYRTGGLTTLPPSASLQWIQTVVLDFFQLPTLIHLTPSPTKFEPKSLKLIYQRYTEAQAEDAIRQVFNLMPSNPIEYIAEPCRFIMLLVPPSAHSPNAIRVYASSMLKEVNIDRDRSQKKSEPWDWRSLDGVPLEDCADLPRLDATHCVALLMPGIVEKEYGIQAKWVTGAAVVQGGPLGKHVLNGYCGNCTCDHRKCDVFEVCPSLHV